MIKSHNTSSQHDVFCCAAVPMTFFVWGEVRDWENENLEQMMAVAPVRCYLDPDLRSQLFTAKKIDHLNSSAFATNLTSLLYLILSYIIRMAQLFKSTQTRTSAPSRKQRFIVRKAMAKIRSLPATSSISVCWIEGTRRPEGRVFQPEIPWQIRPASVTVISRFRTID